MSTSSRRFARKRPSEPGEETRAELEQEADPEGAARRIVLARLSVAARTRHDLAEDLVERGIPLEVTDLVLERFEEVGLVNDAEYAELWVSSRHRTRGLARPVLRQELRNKGVSEELAERALASLSSEDELVRARALIDRKLARLPGGDRVRVQPRLVAHLLRRGYSAAVAKTVVADAIDLHDVQIEG